MSELALDPEDPQVKEYTVPEKWLQLAVTVLVVILSEVAFPGSIGWIYHEVNSNFAGLIQKSIDEILVVLFMVSIHEGIHYWVATLLGYSPKYGVRYMDTFWKFKEPHPYVVVLDEPLSRNDNIVILAAPLILIDLIALVGLLPLSPTSFTHYALLILTLNTALSLADLYNVVRISQMPPNMEFINTMDEDIRTFYKPDRENQ